MVIVQQANDARTKAVAHAGGFRLSCQAGATPGRLHLRGQIHDKVRRMKPRTKISKITLEKEKRPKAWWKPW